MTKLPETPYYREDIPKPAALSFEAEQAMFLAYRRRRTAKRREAIVRQYLYWAAEIAQRYAGPRMPKREAISAANLGLMQAIEDFDPARGRRFVTHSFFAIKRTVLTALRETYVVDPAPGINPHWHRFNKSPRTSGDQKKFMQAKTEVYDALGATVPINTCTSTNAGNGHRPSEFVPNALLTVEDARGRIADESVLALLKDRLGILTPQERTIIERRYFTQDTPLFREIGEALDLDEDHVRYVHNRALERLKHSLRGEV